MSKPIYDITPLTMLDYPEHLATIIWFAGCSMRCSYCYNPKIVLAKSGLKSIADLFTFLKKRQGLLDAVVLSGGECTDYHDILNLCIQIQKLGYKIKIDTNGANPQIIQKLIDKNVVDFIALDYKAPEYKFKQITNVNHFNKFSQSLDIIIQSKTCFEVRTTVHNALLNEKDITAIANDLIKRNYTNTYYLQKFVQTKTLQPTPIQKKWLDLNKINTNLKIEIR